MRFARHQAEEIDCSSNEISQGAFVASAHPQFTIPSLFRPMKILVFMKMILLAN